jgi:hypothetical protein
MKLSSIFLLSFLSETTGYLVGNTHRAFITNRNAETSRTSIQMTAEKSPAPSTFREAEVLGLRFMQEGNFEEALVGKFSTARV